MLLFDKVDSTDQWSVIIATVFLLLLLHTIFQTIAATPPHALSPFLPSIALSDALCRMENGDIVLCYPGRGNSPIETQITFNIICAISRSHSEHIAMLIRDHATDGFVVLENSRPMIRLVPIEQYIQSCHRKGLYVTWRPVRNGGIPRSITDHIVESVIGQRYPTPLQMFAQTIVVLNYDASHPHPFMGNRTCTGLVVDILRRAGKIPMDTDTRGWTTDSLSSRCWPPDHILGCERELIQTVSHPTSSLLDG